MPIVARTPTRAYWRVRRCPDCGYTDRASAFPTNRYGAARNPATPATRWCPECGYTGETSEFRVVREHHRVVSP
jgi:hypothetical protein